MSQHNGAAPHTANRASRTPRPRPVAHNGFVEVRCSGCDALLCKASPGSVVNVVCPKSNCRTQNITVVR